MMDYKLVNLTDPLWLQMLKKLRHDVYHLPEYVYVESIRNSAAPEAILITEGEKIFFVPYLLRNCNSLFGQNLLAQEVFDVVSPYGYPGILLSEAAVEEVEFLNSALALLAGELQAKGVCSAFLRLHPILNHGFEEALSSQFVCQISGETVSANLKLSEAEIWQQTRSEHRNHINRCKRAGFQVRMVNYEDYIDEFISIYKETMDRVDAKGSYYFDDKYFTGLAQLNEKIHLSIVEQGDRVACAGMFTETCGIVQYHLGGTRSEFLKQSPSKLMFDRVRFWAKERGNQVFHLGGGVGGAKDSLYHFKSGFSKQKNVFLTLRLITDEEKYQYLVNLRAKALNLEPEGKLSSTNFFPAYRYSN